MGADRGDKVWGKPIRESDSWAEILTEEEVGHEAVGEQGILGGGNK